MTKATTVVPCFIVPASRVTTPRCALIRWGFVQLGGDVAKSVANFAPSYGRVTTPSAVRRE
jgi:hypothetical protein